jgi:hypothetical protein
MPKRIGQALQGAGKAVEAVADSSGNRLRWSTKNTVSGVIVTTACEQVAIHGITWPAVCLCFVGVLPLALSTLES